LNVVNGFKTIHTETPFQKKFYNIHFSPHLDKFLLFPT
jgi:hypothetical protein